MNKSLRTMLHITAAHCKRQGYRAIPTDATAAEERLADALLDGCEARKLQAEELEDMGVNEMLRKALGRYE